MWEKTESEEMTVAGTGNKIELLGIRDILKSSSAQNLNLCACCLSCCFLSINNRARLICSYEVLYYDSTTEVICVVQGHCGSRPVFWIHLVRSNGREVSGAG